MRIHCHWLFGFFKVHGILRVQIGTRQEIALESRRPRCCGIAGTQAISGNRPPSPKIGVIGHDLPRDTHGRTSAKCDLSHVLAAHKDWKVVVAAVILLGLARVAKQFDALGVGGAVVDKINAQAIGIFVAIVDNRLHRLVAQVGVNLLLKVVGAVFETRVRVDAKVVLDVFLADIGGRRNGTFLKAGHAKILRQSLFGNGGRGKEVATESRPNFPVAMHPVGIDLGGRWNIEEAVL